MFLAAQGTEKAIGVIFLALAALFLYAGSRFGGETFVRHNDSFQPGRRAVGHWIPIFFVTILALFINRTEIALGILFSTSVASLSLVFGSIATLATHEPHDHPIGKTWVFVLPAALMALLVGFKGQFNWQHALMFLLEGFVIASVWRDRSPDELGSDDVESPRKFPVLFLVLALTLSLVGAVLALRGTVEITDKLHLLSGGLVSACLVAPLLSLPIIGSGQILAEKGKAWEAMASCVGVTLLNLCVSLPIVILIWYAKNYLKIPVIPWLGVTQSFPSPEDGAPIILSYPLAVWRIDTVMIVVLGLMLVPVALGRWILGKVEGLILILGYVVYLGLAIVGGLTTR